MRLPKAGVKCPYTGLSRTTLNELCLPCAANDFRPVIRSAVVKRRGALRGVRLINVDSLFAHLNHLADQATAETHECRDADNQA
ncbi:hypothetical protein FPL22_11675 [Rariglobus hedericola]|uniref:Uncharacterized protein n=1 Tax=Rariglobus hedericola TaxID=2597822 RepID=A0A556QLM7_9BACT|nr:hypothetical protein FPL22_11675 [Rariglobus hedericola]